MTTLVIVVAVLCAGAVVTLIGARLIDRTYQPRGKFIDVGGFRQHVSDLAGSGDAKGATPVVLLHGAGANLEDMYLALGERLATRVPQHSINTVTTNVPGPQQPLYAAGRRMLEAYGYVPLAGHVRVGVAIFSYDGHVGFGVTGDYDTAADIGVLCAGIEAGMAELLESCTVATPRRRQRQPPGGAPGGPLPAAAGPSRAAGRAPAAARSGLSGRAERG